MLQRAPERIVPATTRELLDTHPGVSVARDHEGNITVSPTEASKPPYDGFVTTLSMALSGVSRLSSTLRVASRRIATPSLPDTELRVPTYGGLPDKETLIQLYTAPSQVLEMARRGVELLSGLHQLSEEEQYMFALYPDLTARITDDMTGPEPDVAGWVPVEKSNGDLSRASLAVAALVLDPLEY